MNTKLFWGIICLFLLMAFISCKHTPPIPENLQSGELCATYIDYDSQIQPILSSNCAVTGCHDAVTKEEGVIYDNYDNTINKGKVKPGKPNKSEMVEVLTESGEDLMPPAPWAPLTQDQIDLISKWIEQGALQLNCTKECDSISFTYNSVIDPIVNSYCKGCHQGSNPSGNLLLTSYNEVKSSVENGGFLGSIEAINYSLMPPGNSLNDCNIILIKKWINDGAPNN